MAEQVTANNGAGNIIHRDEWETPQWLFDQLDVQYGFQIDCCANSDNKKCKYYYDDFLHTDITLNTAWMNPPFSKADVMFKKFFQVIRRGVAIYRCDNLETELWQEVILPNATWVFFPKGRIKFEGLTGSGSRFPCAIIGVNVDPPKGMPGKVMSKVVGCESD